MRHILLLAAAPLLAISSQSLAAPKGPAVTPEAMMRHIEILASDDYEGRKPGTAGETKTLQYIAGQLAALGLEGAAGNGGWYQPVPLVQRRPFANRASWTVNGVAADLGQDNLILIGKDAVERLENAPVWFVGSGTAAQLEGANLEGGIALMLYEAPKGSPSATERALALHKAGAAAVIVVFGEDVPWSAVSAALKGGGTSLQTRQVPEVQGAMPFAAASRLIDQALLAGSRSETFRAARTSARGTLDVSTEVWSYDSHNVIGRLRGKGSTGESVLYLSHWDHLGICAPEGAQDRICNGAVDNASGIAMMIEIARHISRGDRPQRDLLFMGTTAEEVGLLGAEYYGANPTVPLQSLVAAINIDTVAIAEKGEPVVIVGRGTTPLDPLVDATARELGRAIDSDEEANAFVERQDGWELTKAGVPTVMVGGSFANMAKLQAFLGGPYHKPEDDLKRPIVLGGAAEDTDLMIALGRKLADPRQYNPKAN
jgi:Zn-dependent M28 family amino/carboxypeptidase